MNYLENVISAVSPGWAASRARSRLQLQAASGVSTGEYASANATRLGAQQSYIQSTSLAIGTRNTDGLDKIWIRARGLERNNAICDAMLSRSVENLVGDGFGVQPTTEDPEWNAQAEKLFWEWADTADVQGRSFLRLCRLLLRSHLRDGDVGAALLKDGRLQAFEADLIQSPYKTDKSERVFDGVSVNQFLRPVTYYIKALDENGKEISKPYDAKDFILFANEKRLGSTRGTSYLQTSFGMFDHVDDWIRSSVIAAKLAACFGIIITKNDPLTQVGGFSNTTNSAGNSQPIQDVEPGMIGYLAPGEDIKTLSPAQPSQSFPDQLRAMVRLLGLPLGLPLEMVLLDYSQTSFSSARASNIQAQRSFKTIQALFIEQFLSRIYRWRISKFIKEGKLPDRPDSWSHRWIAPNFPYVDPVKEIQAKMLAIDAGHETLEQQHIANGTDYNKWLTDRSREVAAQRAAGIPLMRGTLSVELTSQPTTVEDLQARIDQLEEAGQGVSNDQNN